MKFSVITFLSLAVTICSVLAAPTEELIKKTDEETAPLAVDPFILDYYK